MPLKEKKGDQQQFMWQLSQKVNNLWTERQYEKLEALFQVHAKEIRLLMDADHQSVLHLACLYSDEKAVRLIVKYMPELVNATNKKHRLPLHIASMCTNTNIISTLLNTPHKNITCLDNRGLSFIHYALFNQSLEIRRRMFELIQRVCNQKKQKKFDDEEGIELLPMGHFPVHEMTANDISRVIDSEDSSGNTILHYIVCEDDEILFDYIAKQNPKNVWRTNAKEMNVLHFAAKNNACKILSKLLDERENKVNSVAWNDSTPLLYAASQDHLEATKILLAHHANLYAQTVMGATILHLLSAKKTQRVWSYLISLNVPLPLGKVNAHFQTPLMVACSKNNHAFVAELMKAEQVQLKMISQRKTKSLDYHLAINARDENGFTALHWAVYQRSIGCVEHLLEHPEISTTRKDKSGYTPLAMAIAMKHLPLVRLLWQSNKAYKLQAMSRNQSYLHLACHRGSQEIVEFLLAQPMVIDKMLNHQDLRNQTPLHVAVKQGEIELVESLLKAGAKNCRDNRGLTPAGLARTLNKPGIANLIDLHFVTQSALQAGYTDNLRFLFHQVAADAHAQVSKSGNSLLHEAAIKGDFNEIQSLLLMGAKPLLLNSEQKTAITLLLEQPATEERIKALVIMAEWVDDLQLLSELIYPWRDDGYNQAYEYVMGECAMRLGQLDLALQFFCEVQPHSGWLFDATEKKCLEINIQRQKEKIFNHLGI